MTHHLLATCIDTDDLSGMPVIGIDCVSVMQCRERVQKGVQSIIQAAILASQWKDPR